MRYRWLLKMNALFTQEGIAVDIKLEVPTGDYRDNLDINEIAVDTGNIDFAANHDHYLYWFAKR